MSNKDQQQETDDYGVPAAALPLTAATALDSAQLVHTSTHQVIPIRNDNAQRNYWLVGRTKESDLRIQHGSISRQHAVLYFMPSSSSSSSTTDKNESSSSSSSSCPACTLILRDLGGKHGTTVNGTKLQQQQQKLQQGDTLQFGKVRESIFRVEWKTTTVLPAAGTTTTIDNTKQATKDTLTSTASSVQKDQQALEQAGEGLTGRAKRQAEIDAMMASLDQDVTYTKTAPQPTTSQPNDDDDDDDHGKEEATIKPLPPKYASLPVSGVFTIPPDSHDEGRLTCVTVDPPGSRIAVGRRDATLSLYDFGGMDEVRRQAFTTVQPLPDAGHYPLQSLAYSPTADRILVGLANVQPVLLDRDGQFIRQFARGDMYLQDPTKTIGHTAAVTAVAWHNLDKDIVFTAARDGSVRRWNVERGKLQFDKLCSQDVWIIKSGKGHKTVVTSLALHPAGRSFAVGTADGTLQIWNMQRKRPDKVVLAGTAAITALCFSADGKTLASRASDESVAKIWKLPTLTNRTTQPALICLGLPTIHETANVALSPKADYLVAGATAMHGSGSGNGGSPKEQRGSLNFYDLTQNQTGVLEPCFDVDMKEGPVTVNWHPRFNQVVTGCSDGSLVVYFATNTAEKNGGVWTALKKSNRNKRTRVGEDDSLTALLRERAREAGPSIMGEILTPLASQHKRQKKDLDTIAKREPERPASGKHKAGGAGSAVTTFAQYIADQSVQQDIAGKDPRQALLKYKDGKSYLGKESKILDTKTMEQQGEEEKQ